MPKPDHIQKKIILVPEHSPGSSPKLQTRSVISCLAVYVLYPNCGEHYPAHVRDMIISTV
jgi:hypothetical protein